MILVGQSLVFHGRRSPETWRLTLQRHNPYAGGGMIFLLIGLLFVGRIPGLLKTGPEKFGAPDPNLFQLWKSKELWSIYILLMATWGQTAIFFCIGLVLGFTMGAGTKLNQAIVVVSAVEVVVFLAGLIWAAVLGSQAAKLKKQLQAAPPPSFYPRAGATVLQAEEGIPPTEG